MRNKKLKPRRRYFPAFFFFASARRSVFFRRLARLLALSLPLLFPICTKTHPVTPSRHVVVQRKPEPDSKVANATLSETEAGVPVRLRRTAFHAEAVPGRPEL